MVEPETDFVTQEQVWFLTHLDEEDIFKHIHSKMVMVVGRVVFLKKALYIIADEIFSEVDFKKYEKDESFIERGYLKLLIDREVII